MQAEGRLHVNPARFGWLAFLRQKQWWSFEGLDPERQRYFVLLALEGFPSSYVSLTVIDYARGQRWSEEHLGAFHAAPGAAVDVAAQGAWGHLRFQGQASAGWRIDARTATFQLTCRQAPQAPLHTNRLLTRHLDYNIQQFPFNTAQGTLMLTGQSSPFQGYGYCEHNWGVQPRHSRANWLHVWAPDLAGIVLDCHYDAGVPHHYSYLWQGGQARYLASPAHFFFDPEALDQPWPVRSPDIDLTVTPLYSHHTRMRLPPVLPYIDVDYYEQLVSVAGHAQTPEGRVAVQGVGKFDHNFNKW